MKGMGMVMLGWVKVNWMMDWLLPGLFVLASQYKTSAQMF